MRQGTRLVAGVLAATATAGALVAAGVAILLSHIVDLRASANATLRTGVSLEATINLEELVVDAETGLRGYVITGQSLFLAPERAAAAQLPGAAAALERATENDGAFVLEARSLVASSQSYMNTYVPQVIREVTHDPGAAQSFATTAEGKSRVDGIRAQTSSLERLISARQTARQRAAHASANTAVRVAVVVLIVLTVLTVALAGILGWLLVGRERARKRTEELYRASEQTALTLQQSLLPAEIPDVPSCELAIRFEPARAGELVGGDFYDVFEAGDEQWVLVIGDVCGKGPQAAAVTAMARWTLRTLAAEGQPPTEVLSRLNEAMLRHDLGGRFITLIYALVDVRGDEARVTLACAGHPPAIHVSDRGEPSLVPANGDLLGVWPEIRLRDAELSLSPGAALVLCTDGVTDQGPTHPGAERSADQALRGVDGDGSAAALADALLDEAGRWSGAARDDVAIVALRYLSSAERIAPRGLTGATAGA